MNRTLRDRAEWAAKYDAKILVPVIEIKQLLDELDQATALIQRVRRQADRAEQYYKILTGPVMAHDIRRALDAPLREEPALAEGGEQR